jgi:hypothetical protein
VIKAIETVYDGYKFRSRLEARWAVALNACAIPWNYELEGFHTAAGRYLPDFWLPGMKVFLEIKPEAPNEVERAKAEALCERAPVAILYGDIGEDVMALWVTPQRSIYSQAVWLLFEAITQRMTNLERAERTAR